MQNHTTRLLSVNQPLGYNHLHAPKRRKPSAVVWSFRGNLWFLTSYQLQFSYSGKLEQHIIILNLIHMSKRGASRYHLKGKIKISKNICIYIHSAIEQIYYWLPQPEVCSWNFILQECGLENMKILPYLISFYYFPGQWTFIRYWNTRYPIKRYFR